MKGSTDISVESKTRLSGKAKLNSTRSLQSKDSLKTGPPSSKRPKKPSVAKLKKLADAWFSKATRYRFAEQINGEWVAKCVTCSNAEWKPIKTLQCGHFMSRQHNATRFLEENCAPQDYGCNVMQQGKQYEFGLWIDAMYGEGTAKRLHKEAKQLHQFTAQELLDIIEDCKQQVLYYEAQ